MTTNEAIKWFEEELIKGKCSPDCPQCNAYETALSILRLYKQMEWISVKDRLPDKDIICLCCYGFNKEEVFCKPMYIGTLTYFAVDKSPHWQHEGLGLYVTHWMPLPELPIERNEK